MKDCCMENIREPILKSRAHWICKICGEDISLAYVLFKKCIEPKEWEEK